MDKKEYEATIEVLQIELIKMQNWVKKSGERVVIILEGRDAAGKGGTIRRFLEHMNPRSARVVALEKPTEKEKGQWYFQRYISQLPSAGEIVLFDRSWYNRAGVERVMGFCTPKEHLEFLRQTPSFEHLMVSSGFHVFKIWLSVSQEEQRRRFQERQQDPLKQWKLSPMDIAAMDRWEDYTKAKEEMFFYTDSPESPWTIVHSDDKQMARIQVMKLVLSTLCYEGKDESVVTGVDPKVVQEAKVYMKTRIDALSHLSLTDLEKYRERFKEQKEQNEKKGKKAA